LTIRTKGTLEHLYLSTAMLFSMPKQEKTQANKTDNIADRQIGEPRKKTTTVTQRV